MALFFFDCADGASTHPDVIGMELADADEAADHAAGLLRAIFAEGTETSGMRALSIVVRGRDGRPVYAAHAGFHGWRVAADAA